MFSARHIAVAVGLPVLLCCSWAGESQAEERPIGLFPTVRLGWGNAESIFVDAGVGVYRYFNREMAWRIGASGQLGLGGFGSALEFGVCRDGSHSLPCAMDLSLGAKILRTTSHSSWDQGSFVGLEVGGRLLLLGARVGVLRLIGAPANVSGHFSVGIGFP